MRPTMESLPLFNMEFARLAAPFVERGILDHASVHVVDLLAHEFNEPDAEILLGLAFAVHAPRGGHVGVDLTTIEELFKEENEETAQTPGPVSSLHWPEGVKWHASVSKSTLLGQGETRKPFVAEHSLIISHRYWTYQDIVRARLLEMAADAAPGVGAHELNRERLRGDLSRLFPAAESGDLQRLGALVAVLRRLTVISGGPGTGKTFTVRKILALLSSQWRAAGLGQPHVALAAPTGKAAVRMREAIESGMDERDATGAPLFDADAETREWLKSLVPSTLHRLLGYQPRTPTRFRHNADSPLPFDVVVVDEASMVDVALMAKLVDAVGPGTRLILLGDRNQLASVEAGSVLADITRDAHRRRQISPSFASQLRDILGEHAPDDLAEDDAPPLSDCIVHFEKAYRVKEQSGLQAVTYAIPDGPHQDRSNAVAWLCGRKGSRKESWSDIIWSGHAANGRLEPKVLERIVRAYGGEDSYLARLLAGPRGDESMHAFHADVLRRFERVRVLASHREGHLGVAGLNRTIRDEIARSLDLNVGYRFWPGRPLIVTRNSPELGVMNGDVGIVVDIADRRTEEGSKALELRVAFPTPERDRVLYLSVAQLPEHETVFGMTIHKSQGSEFDETFLVLPAHMSRILTRELIYTGLTRAKKKLHICGSEEILKAGLEREIRRASALDQLLWE